MKTESLAFVNQQLAGMLKAGLPLEGALKQLCRNLHDASLRRELEQLEADLGRGLPLAEAIASRRLPELYRRLILLGARGDDLPGTLAMVADHYQRAHLMWTRLKGLLTYPLIVLCGCAALAAFMGWMFHHAAVNEASRLDVLFPGSLSFEQVRHALVLMWAPLLGLGGLGLLLLAAVAVPRWRSRLRWRLPGFREDALAQLASTLHLLLAKGSTLPEAVALARDLEEPSPAAAELGGWLKRIEGGQGKPAEFAAEGRVIPPLWRWMVAQGGEDLAAGFGRAANLYQARAMHESEVLLYLALPMSVLILGMLLLTEFAPLFRLLAVQLDMLGSVD
jgi:type II secretory pathway component PulF